MGMGHNIQSIGADDDDWDLEEPVGGAAANPKP